MAMPASAPMLHDPSLAPLAAAPSGGWLRLPLSEQQRNELADYERVESLLARKRGTNPRPLSTSIDCIGRSPFRRAVLVDRHKARFLADWRALPIYPTGTWICYYFGKDGCPAVRLAAKKKDAMQFARGACFTMRHR